MSHNEKPFVIEYWSSHGRLGQVLKCNFQPRQPVTNRGSRGPWMREFKT